MPSSYLTAFNQAVEAHISAQCPTEKQTATAPLPETSTASSKHAAPTFRKSHKTVSGINRFSVQSASLPRLRFSGATALPVYSLGNINIGILLKVQQVQTII